MTGSAIAVEGTAAAEMARSGVTSPVAALLALAAAVLLAVYASGPRCLQALVAAADATGPPQRGRPVRRRSRDDPADVAAAWGQLAVCLEAGLPVAAAVAAAAATLPGPTGGALGRVAGLLELGADPTQAWKSVQDVPDVAAFARAAGRSAGTGAALARAARTEGSRVRADLADGAVAWAQRAGVLVAGPLGLCFLPAFLVLGGVPVVVGLATDVLQQW
jgi:Flp pilus assembly protein TadB